MRVVVTRPEPECEGWVARLREAGFDAVALPLIAIRPAPDGAALAQAWRDLSGYRAAMFVSANAVRGFLDCADSAWPDGVRAWSTGNGTRGALLDGGVPAESIDSPAADSPQFDSEALWRGVHAQVNAGDRVLIVRGGEAGTGRAAGRDWLAETLREADVEVTTVVAYLRDAPAWTAAQFALAQACSESAVWLFSSSQAIANLQSLLPDTRWSQARAVATHPRIAQSARDASFGVVCESRPAMADVIAALESLR